MDDILDHEVDPTTVVSDDDMQTIRKHIRYAYAVRLHVWGFWDVLFRTSEDLFRQKQLPIPSRIGSLGFAFIISEHRLASGPSTPTSTATPSTSQHNPSSTILPSTQVTGRIECDFESSAYVGLCINLRGKRYLTTASHAFVSRDTVAGRSKTDTAIRRDRKELQSTLHPTPWTRLSRSVLDYIFQRDRRKRYIGPETSDFRTHLEHKTSDVLTPVNVPVYLEGSGVLGGPESQLGRIAKTYDDLPWRVGPHPNLFPTSFKHDLALVEAADDRPLPKMVTQDWHPRSRPQFARAEDCLVQTPAFLVQHLPKYSERRVWKKGSIALQHLKQVLISGVDYLFDSEGEHVTRALIWRTEDDLRGASGSVVCRGNSKDKEVDAVIFQNFETTLSQKLSGYTEQAPQPVKGSVGLVNYKGGFFLPKEILDALIEVEAAKNLTTTFSDDFKNDFTKPEKKDQNTIPPSTSDPLH
ncbi:hypothetical protein C8R45DRAFT_982952 [Mycena sanguinolenta]|nr:hypothetical protein C8R45DRAFT_982952 [Mycena sanguinolenta]